MADTNISQNISKSESDIGFPRRMNIATALNSKYMRYTYVMLTSLFQNQLQCRDEIHVYLLHSDLTAQDQEHLESLAQKYGHKVHFLLINRESFPASLPTTTEWSLETYFRLMLLDILPDEVDRLLYLDVDMIINKPVDDLYFTDFEDRCFCACRDMTVELPFPDIRNEIFKEHIAQDFTYFNAGLMLWNIEKLRGSYSFKDYMELAHRLNYQMLAPDQDLLNYMHWNQVKFVDEYQYDLFSKIAYNYDIHYEQVKAETTIIHFAGPKPWEGEYVHYDIEQLWWDYAKQTPFYAELMEEFLHASLNNPLVYGTLNSLSEEKQRLAEELQKSSALCRKLMQLLESQ